MVSNLCYLMRCSPHRVVALNFLFVGKLRPLSDVVKHYVPIGRLKTLHDFSSIIMKQLG
jgi:hypothetical protein